MENLYPLLVADRRWLQKWLAMGRDAREKHLQISSNCRRDKEQTGYLNEVLYKYYVLKVCPGVMEAV